MLSRIKVFFAEKISAPLQANESSDSGADSRALMLTSIALLLEMLRMDELILEDELDKLKHILLTEYDVNASDLDELINLAGEEAHNAVDYYRFTSLINQQLNQQQKFALIKNLWRIAYADGSVDKLEEHLARKIAELIHVPHSEFIRARHMVMEETKQ